MTFDEVYPELLAVVSEASARPDVPLESEIFFSNVIENFAGSKKDFLAYVKSHLYEWFRYISIPPAWIQDADWPFSQGKPRVFLGQTEVSASLGWFHDDAIFYHFWDPQIGATQSVIQVS